VVVGELEQARDALRGPEPLLEVFRRLAAPAGDRPAHASVPGRRGVTSAPGRPGAPPAPGPSGGLSPVEARTLLAKFRIGADVVLRPADTLSPGERTRAGLALFQARGSTCLILDEPTNHLDLPAIEQLEQALATYQGTLLLVTHDRRLAAAVAITHELDVTSLHSR
jgi:hypothetical protein